MKEEIAKIKENSVKEIKGCKEEKELNELKVKYLGKKGELTVVLRGMGKLTKLIKSSKRRTRNVNSRKRKRI